MDLDQISTSLGPTGASLFLQVISPIIILLGEGMGNYHFYSADTSDIRG